MKALRETTVYKDFVAPDHVYFVDNNKLVAYKVKDQPVHICATPLMFDKRGRTFDTLKDVNLVELGLTD